MLDRKKTRLLMSLDHSYCQIINKLYSNEFEECKFYLENAAREIRELKEVVNALEAEMKVEHLIKSLLKRGFTLSEIEGLLHGTGSSCRGS